MERPKAQKNTIRVSGVLRIRVTYAVPKARNTATGDTRMTATTVPMISAPIAAETVSLIVIQNAATHVVLTEQLQVRPSDSPLVHVAVEVRPEARRPRSTTASAAS